MHGRALRVAGYGFALAAALLAGSVNVATKHALGFGVGPVTLAAAAHGLAALVLAGYAVTWRPRDRRDLVIVVTSALIGTAFAPAALFLGLARTTAVTAALLVNIEVLATAVLAYAFLKERFGGREGIALAAIAVGGVVVTVGPDLMRGSLPDASNLLGAGLVALAAFAWGVDSTMTTPLTRRYRVRALLGVKHAIGAAVLVVVALVAESGGVPRAVWPHAVFVGVAGAVAAILFMYAAFRRVGATRTVVLFGTAGLWGAVLARVFLGEALTLPHLAGAALMLGGVVGLARAGHAGEASNPGLASPDP